MKIVKEYDFPLPTNNRKGIRVESFLLFKQNTPTFHSLPSFSGFAKLYAGG